MGHSRAEKEQSRERILEAAARMIREVGPNGISIADLMKSANMTHGGFYGHFPSRENLIVAAIERAIDDGAKSFASLPDGEDPGSVKSIANRYLSTPHRDNIARGCALASLGTEVGRLEERQGRQLLQEHAENRFDHMAEAMGGGEDTKDASVAAWCTMVGAVVLSRVFRGSKRADEILEIARKSVQDFAAKSGTAETPPSDGESLPRAKKTGIKKGAPNKPGPQNGD